jgi:peptide/nickel transport system substrate-binding protein
MRKFVLIGAVALATALAVPVMAGALGGVSGPGLTTPTHPHGAKVKGGTVFFTEGPQAPPNYIFPQYDFAACGVQNINQLMDILYKPLYWFGNDYRPTIDYANYSIGKPPVFSHGGKTVTIHLNSWKWSDGEKVTARDLVFWMNLIKINPSVNWCGSAVGYFPYNVSSYFAKGPSTFVINFNKKYDPEWILYSELSQLTPIPLAWDRTAMNQNPLKEKHLPDTTLAGATAVYKFLDTQSKNLGSWGNSPLWRVVDGPFYLQSVTADGETTLVPNKKYSGMPKPSISKLVELPFTSNAAIFNEMRAGGPSAITIGNIPAEDAPQTGALASEGYTINNAASYSFNYIPLNFNTSATTSPGGEPLRYIIRQTYFRQAFQHLVDQLGWIHAFLHNTATPTCGPIPAAPASPLVSASAVSFKPCAFSVSQASQLLSSNGWHVVPGGTTTCETPAKCGSGISKGEGISVPIDYQGGVPVVANEMNDLASNAKRVGINISLTTHPFDSVVAEATPCTPDQASCSWVLANWGAGWIYGPSYLPTGEPLYNTGSAANAGNYSDAKMTSLISGTIVGPLKNESAALSAYAKYASSQEPVIFGPTSIGTYAGDAGTVVNRKLGGYAANALGLMNPEDWYFVK